MSLTEPGFIGRKSYSGCFHLLEVSDRMALPRLHKKIQEDFEGMGV